MVFVVCCRSLCVDVALVLAVRCSLFLVRRLPFVVCYHWLLVVIDRYSLIVVRCLLFVRCLSLLPAVCCLLCAVCS